MKAARRTIIVSTLAALECSGIVAAVQVSAHLNSGLPIDTPGSITDLPAARGVTYESPLSAGVQVATIRQALDAAEREFGSVDTQVDPIARVVPVVVSIGLTPAYQHMKALVVTTDGPIYLPTRPGTAGQAAYKFCVVIDAVTGKYIMAYPAGPRTTLSQ